MKLRQTSWPLLALAACLVLVAPPAQAVGLLLGNDLLITFEDDDPAPREIKASTTVTVIDPGTEINSGFGNGVSIDITDTRIIFLFSQSTFFGGPPAVPVSFNGYVFNDANGTIPKITSAVLNPMSDVTPVVFFDDDNVYVDFKGISFEAGDQAIVDVVPEPSSALLLLFGSGLLLRRRRH